MTTKMAVVAGQNSEQLSNNFEVGPKFFGLICNLLKLQLPLLGTYLHFL